MASAGRPAGGQLSHAGCLHVAAAWVIAIGELVTVAGGLLFMYAGLKINGQVFTEMLEKTRLVTWEFGSGLVIVAGAGASAYFLVRVVVTRSGIGMLLAQLTLLLVIAGLVAWFHGAIPVPPGWYGRGIPAY